MDLPPNFSCVPLDIARLIASECTVLDVLRLGQTNKFWLSITREEGLWRQFLHNWVTTMTPLRTVDMRSVEAHNYKQLLLRLFKNRTHLSEWSVNIWGSGSHVVNIIDDVESVSGNVALFYDAYVNRLCGTVRNVLPGRYAVAWCLKLDDVCVTCPVTFSASPRAVGSAEAATRNQGCVVKWEVCHWAQLTTKYGNNKWFTTTVGTIDIEGVCHVELQLSNLSVEWKSSIYVDYVALIPVEALEMLRIPPAVEA